ncbi:serine hydrolase [Candidatus Saccharibacteria bacterium QS_5_54_17]|nr:MAG: serine hydrolase [Candidatus Saccharibacteria bacterium QS_5_54_17]
MSNNSNNSNSNNHNSGAKKAHNGRKNAHEATRQTRRNQDDAQRRAGFDDVVTDADKARMAMKAKQANQLHNGEQKLRVIPIGGQDGVGDKNMAIIEYGDDAIVVDAGFNLSVDLPGINYTIPDSTYLEAIQHKLRAYVFTHGHLDHIGATPYIIPQFPAPVYGSQFTVGMVQKQIEDADIETDFTPETVPMNIDNHERLKIGPFFIEMIRVTHSIPDSCAVAIDTPVGRILHTGDFRLDPEPLDNSPTDLDRVKELARDGIMLLMTESTNSESPGRTPTEHTLQQSFHDILHQSPGRVLISSFSTNINRIQMIVNGAVESGRKVAIDGRSMLACVELAVKLGYIKIPKGTLVAMKDLASLQDQEVAIVCTGSQGEPNAALERIGMGDHTYITLKTSDTVVLSSSPIPGKEVSVMESVDRLMRAGATVLRHRTHEIDGCGPLHVSGHGNRDEQREMLELTRPDYVMPNHGPFVHRQRYREIALEAGIDPDKVTLVDNGDILEFNQEGKLRQQDSIPTGSLLIDQTGTLVPNLVIKDRLLMSEEGIVVVVLTIDKKSKQLLSSPDIISRGFLHMQENAELIDNLRQSLREFTQQQIKRLEIKEFKQQLRDEVNNFLYQHTQRAAVIIPVVNVVGSGSGSGGGKQQPNRRPPGKQSKPQQKQQQKQQDKQQANPSRKGRN